MAQKLLIGGGLVEVTNVSEGSFRFENVGNVSVVLHLTTQGSDDWLHEVTLAAGDNTVLPFDAASDFADSKVSISDTDVDLDDLEVAEKDEDSDDDDKVSFITDEYGENIIKVTQTGELVDGKFEATLENLASHELTAVISQGEWNETFVLAEGESHHGVTLPTGSLEVKVTGLLDLSDYTFVETPEPEAKADGQGDDANG